MLPYLDIRFDGNSLNRHQFSAICSYSYIDDPLSTEIMEKIRYGALRLGKTLIFISVDEGHRRVLLFSSDGLVVSHYYEIYGYFAYEERIKDLWLASQESVLHRKHIYNLLRSYLD